MLTRASHSGYFDNENDLETQRVFRTQNRLMCFKGSRSALSGPGPRLNAFRGVAKRIKRFGTVRNNCVSMSFLMSRNPGSKLIFSAKFHYQSQKYGVCNHFWKLLIVYHEILNLFRQNPYLTSASFFQNRFNCECGLKGLLLLTFTSTDETIVHRSD